MSDEGRRTREHQSVTDGQLRGLTPQDLDRLCFDFTELATRLSAAEDWSKLVVAQIYIDHIITQSLRDRVPNIDAYLKGGHKSFSDKLALCLAHGLVDADLAVTLAAINSARNKFAHRLTFDVPDALKVKLFSGFSPKRPPSDVLGAQGFEDFLFTVVMLIEFERIFGVKLAHIESQLLFYHAKIFEVTQQLYGPARPAGRQVDLEIDLLDNS